MNRIRSKEKIDAFGRETCFCPNPSGKYIYKNNGVGNF